MNYKETENDSAGWKRNLGSLPKVFKGTHPNTLGIKGCP